jgi:hypothetical protein
MTPIAAAMVSLRAAAWKDVGLKRGDWTTMASEHWTSVDDARSWYYHIAPTAGVAGRPTGLAVWRVLVVDPTTGHYATLLAALEPLIATHQADDDGDVDEKDESVRLTLYCGTTFAAVVRRTSTEWSITWFLMSHLHRHSATCRHLV